jgi:hypothetical protein
MSNAIRHMLSVTKSEWIIYIAIQLNTVSIR